MTKLISQGNRGKALEDLVEYSNNMLKARGKTCIQKIPTPVRITGVDRLGRVSGFTDKKSTVDFIGTHYGIPICFDAKETKGVSFSQANVHQHQIEFMQEFKNAGGVAFLLVMFTDVDEAYRIDIDAYTQFYKIEKRKSIPLEHFKERDHRVQFPNYLKGILEENGYRR